MEAQRATEQRLEEAVAGLTGAQGRSEQRGARLTASVNVNQPLAHGARGTGPPAGTVTWWVCVGSPLVAAGSSEANMSSCLKAG